MTGGGLTTSLSDGRVGAQLGAASARQATVAAERYNRAFRLPPRAAFAQPLALDFLLQSTLFFRCPVEKYVPCPRLDVLGVFSIGLLDSSACFVITQYFSDPGNPPTGERFQPRFRTAYEIGRAS